MDNDCSDVIKYTVKAAHAKLCKINRLLIVSGDRMQIIEVPVIHGPTTSQMPELLNSLSNVATFSM